MPIGHGEDLANVAAQAMKDTVDKTAEVTAKATGNIAKMLLEMILNRLKQTKEKDKLGKTNLEEILKSGQEVKMVEMNKADIKDFAKLSKEYGIQFAVIGKKSKDVKSIMFKASDVERVQKALEKLIEIKVQRDQDQQKKQELKELKSQHKTELNELKAKQKIDRVNIKNKTFDLSEPTVTPNVVDVGKVEFKSEVKPKEDNVADIKNDEVTDKGKSDPHKFADIKDRVADIFRFDDVKNPLFKSDKADKSMKIIDPNKPGIDKYGFNLQMKNYDDGYFNGTELHFLKADGKVASTYRGWIDDRLGTLTDHLKGMGFSKEQIKELQSDKDIGKYLKSEIIEKQAADLLKSEILKEVDPAKGNISYLVDKSNPLNYIEISKTGKELNATIFNNDSKSRSRSLKDYNISSIENEMAREAKSYKEPAVVTKKDLEILKDNFKNPKDQRPSVKVKLNKIKSSRDVINKSPKGTAKGKVKVAVQGEK